MIDNKEFEENYEINSPVFTRQMAREYTILLPTMLPIHFRFFEKALIACGYKTRLLNNHDDIIRTEGLKYVHNDTCYPALLVIGQFINALDNMSKEETHKVALLITQTGGGCRASNYIHLLRKALIKAHYEYVPVISLNAKGLDKKSGFRITYPLIKRLAAAMTYGDMLMYMRNKVISYEAHKGDSDNIVNKYVDKIGEEFLHNKGVSFRDLKKNINAIAQDFDKVEIIDTVKPRVGIVGEIYIKYSALGNNHLEDFLINEGAEISVPGLYGFLFYSCYNTIYDRKLYKISLLKTNLTRILIKYLERRENLMIKAIKKTKYTPMNSFDKTKDYSRGVLSHGTKMGEGWLLTAEMVELVETGYKNIVCAQPFGCLPNHICGKGVMKKIKSIYPDANIVAIDYDPSATKVNQENRIKLMLAMSRETLDSEVKH
ncbi:MAG: 2-hydroxyacyl-CoA dehydratase [Acholeplasmatales bacterium]|nr:2-hydroxyacyl-CoA dehydratase [Acholeplasmatales bacterium]